MSRENSLGGRLYSGQVSFDFVGRRKLWYTISAVLILVSLTGLLVRGLTLSVDFRGGSVYSVQTTTGTVDEARSAVSGAGVDNAVVTKTGSDHINVTTDPLTQAQSDKVRAALAKTFDVNENDISVQAVGASWGRDITKKALTGLVVFVILVVILLSFYFEWRMALAAVIALAHDLIITAGVYAIVGFQVSPATVIGFLTILGYSLYDTVVVFDKVRENTAGIERTSRMTYSEAANLAVNQTLVRSINTSVVALLPVASILFVGAGLLGAGTLEDLALALFVGIAVGTYSSIFVATPVAAQLKEREPAMKALARRVAARRAAGKDQELAAANAGDRGRTTGVAPTSDATVASDGEPDAQGAQPVGASTRSTGTAVAGQPTKRVQPKGKKRTGKRR